MCIVSDAVFYLISLLCSFPFTFYQAGKQKKCVRAAVAHNCKVTRIKEVLHVAIIIVNVHLVTLGQCVVTSVISFVTRLILTNELT